MGFTRLYLLALIWCFPLDRVPRRVGPAYWFVFVNFTVAMGLRWITPDNIFGPFMVWVFLCMFFAFWGPIIAVPLMMFYTMTDVLYFITGWYAPWYEIAGTIVYIVRCMAFTDKSPDSGRG